MVAKKITSLDRHLMFKDDSFFHVPDDFPKTKVEVEVSKKVDKEVDDDLEVAV